jgi:uncharacterized protein YecT (DUF1311 family)
MDESEFAPDLSKLDNRYQILSELRRARNGRIFLARHTELNRDVTIDVVHVPRGDDDALRFLASDAELLSNRRNAHVIPAIEGRWLGDDAFAMVRPRVRGSTLTQLISALGTVPTQRMSGILEQVHNALQWARANGIVNRSVAPDDIVLQQGSGRVLVAFGRDPEATELPNACDDVRTVGQLAWAMLAGGPPSAAPTKPLAERRPDLPPQLIHATEALITCDRDGEPPDVNAFLVSLGGIASRASSSAEAAPVVVAREEQGATADFGDESADEITDESPIPTIEDEITEESPVPTLEAEQLPVEDQVEVGAPGTGPLVVASDEQRPLSGEIKTLPTVIDTPDRPAAAVGAESDAEVVVVKRRGMSFGARMLTAVAVAVVIIAVFLLFARRGDGTAPRMATNTADSSALAAGDVALRGQQRRADTSSQPPVSVSIVPQPGAQTAPAGGTTASSATPMPNQSANPAQNPATANPLAPPTKRRSEPPVSTKPVTIVPPTSRDTALPRDSARVRSAAEVCASADPGDQRTCLGQLIKDNDTELNAVFRRLVTAMRRKANIADQDPEPQAILDLREAERRWVDDRDAACRDAGAGPRYARARAGCYADQSARRVRELRQMLDSIPPG